ncbi:MAG: hypothetical protein HN341_01510 [Verrucomicrobia bacterium]|jgi:hypothetical protein|nr:hypothetical protein [Verrucomicrobiota bacterium]
MSAVNEWIVREYFESLGFLVGQPRKYAVPGRQKKAEEEIDLVVYNPTVSSHRVPEGIIWGTDAFVSVKRAVVGVRGWHTERFYASTFEQAPDILRFVEDDSVRFAAGLLGSNSMAKVLCLPRLPTSEELRDKTIDVLRESGIDGIVSFHTMLEELITHVDINRNYEKSDVLQVIRLLKNYGFIKDAQMELFGKRPRSEKS